MALTIPPRREVRSPMVETLISSIIGPLVAGILLLVIEKWLDED
ncbi:TPA: hypothetical protein ACT2FU_001476 [Streptococcus suis]